MPKRFAALRLLLLALLALGVLGMHTMGHPSDRHGTGAMAASHETLATPTVPVMNAAMQAAAAELVTVPHSGGGLDLLQVCMAILTAVGLAALIACALLAAHGAGGVVAPVPAAFAPVGRGPPRRPAFGLVLADLSVLRR